MKKSHKIIYFSITIFAIILIGFGIYNAVYSANKKDDEIESKVISEIKYLDEKLVSFFNEMNNVEYENYKLVVQNLGTTNNSGEDQKLNESSNLANGEQSGEGSQNSTQSSSNSNNENGKNGENSSGQKENEENSSDKSQEQGSTNTQNQSSQQEGTSSNTENKEQTKEYSMQEAGILVDSKDIDWEEVQTQVENLYVSIPTITLDLYKTTKNQEQILNFNSQFDELTLALKNENKEETLSKLVNLYETMNNFVSEISKDDNEKIIYETKLNILKAYSKLDSKNWQEISNDVQTATKNFELLLTDIEVSNQKQYAINKIYIMLNEIQSAVEKQDQDVFLIKYKNLLEDLNNI